MSVYIINSDRESLGGAEPNLAAWVTNRMAFAGGARKFGERFGKIAPGDTCLLYDNGVGVVAIGICLAPWDGRNHEESPYYQPMLYPPEYRLSVDWGHDLLVSPVSRDDLARMCGYKPAWSPSQSVVKISNPSAELVDWIDRNRGKNRLPDELPTADTHGLPEGAKYEAVLNGYERSEKARSQCIAHWGTRCQVCDLSFWDTYGELGRDYIHVHHLTPIASIGREYILDPVGDLRPVCPNCHAMLHRTSPPQTIGELRSIVLHSMGAAGAARGQLSTSSGVTKVDD